MFWFYHVFFLTSFPITNTLAAMSPPQKKQSWTSAMAASDESGWQAEKHHGCPEELGAAPSRGGGRQDGVARAKDQTGTFAQTSSGRSVPDGITRHLLREAKDTLQSAADLYEEEHKAAAKEAAAPPSKEGMDVDEFGGLDHRDDPVPEARIQSIIDHLLQAQTKGDREAGGAVSTNGERSQFPGAKDETKARVTPPAGAQQRSLQ